MRAPAEFDGAFRAALTHGAQAMVVNESSMLFAHRAQLAALAATSQFPAAGVFRQSAEAGYLMAYGPNMSDLFRRTAAYVDKILRGAKLGDLPIEQPTRFELVINAKTATALGLRIPPSLLQRADQVIE